MLPIFKTDDRDFSMMQTKWASEINPVIDLPWSSGLLLKGVALVSGSNSGDHKLGRNLQGWIPVRFHGAWAQIYDTQDQNTMPSLTLLLHTSGNVTVDLMVF